MSEKLLLLGNYGSPYSRKMIALLRYRQIPYQLLWGDAANPPQHQGAQLPKAKPAFLPTFYIPNENGELQALTDSTPLIRRFETEYSGHSVIPKSPVLAFVNSLLEDFADEWGTKYMFHYRWSYEADIDRAGTIIPLWISSMMPTAVHRKVKAMFAERQVSRLSYVGSNPQTLPIIEASYRRLLLALNTHFEEHRFLLGSRPSSADFALFGQLSQLVAFDPTPMKIAYEIAPRVVAWTNTCDDLSGVEASDDDWFSDAQIPASLGSILAEVAKGYVPAMLANAEAALKGQTEWHTSIDGAVWKQNTFPYQVKCLSALRAEYANLDGGEQAQLNRILQPSGCDVLLSD